MRMRDLEKASGFGRETIRFYIREGLLPEPLRTSRNSAIYDEEHLTRLLAIRRLRDDRFLPLGVIRTLLASPPDTGWESPEVLPHVDRLLRARLDRKGDREDARQILAEAGQEDELASLVELGVVTLAEDGSVSPRDARILRLLNDLARLGFSGKAGYHGQALGRYVEAMRWLAELQVREFVANTGTRMDDPEAADMAERGLPLLLDLLGELFVREILGQLEDRAEARNPPSGSAPPRNSARHSRKP